MELLQWFAYCFAFAVVVCFAAMIFTSYFGYEIKPDEEKWYK